VFYFAGGALTEQALSEWEAHPNVDAVVFTSHQADVRRMSRQAKNEGGWRAA
jgi:hypothetical protein